MEVTEKENHNHVLHSVASVLQTVAEMSEGVFV